MIDVQAYRERIGQFCPRSRVVKSKTPKYGWEGSRVFCSDEHGFNNNVCLLLFLYYLLFVIYIGVFMLAVVIDHSGMDWSHPSFY